MENKEEINALLDVLKRISRLSKEDIENLDFGSEAEAYKFYCDYARWKGFSVRKDDLERDHRGVIIMRQLVCSREGHREAKHLNRVDRCREEKPITRTGCKAKLRLYMDFRSSKWKVVKFIETHNHELTPSELVHLIPAYRDLTDADKAQVDSLHLHGIKTSHIMGLMVGQKGGHKDLGFCPKDLYNYLDQQKRTKIVDGDAFAALCYLQAKADNDPMMFTKFTSSGGRLQHLFWADGGCKVDYHCFGDVVAFDTTYKKNKYNRPLVIFCGYNQHGQTTIFGCALVADEKTETYIWVLTTFLEAMSGKHPIGVVTDSDGAMREAIKVVFPNAVHRLCGWHIQQNACENVKNSKFLKEFKYLIYTNMTTEAFEDEWIKIVEKYGLRKNAWMTKMHKTKKMWAMAYLREHFFAGIRTTSVCEGINSFIKRYVEHKNTLVDLIHNFERAMKHYRHNELKADFKSMYGEPVMTTALYNYEVAAAKSFTRNKFKEVKKEIVDVAAVNVIDLLEHGDIVQLKLNKFCHPHVEFVVTVNRSELKFNCNCRLFESRGIPCCHIFAAMTHLHIHEFPPTLICKRWIKSAKVDYMCKIAEEVKENEKVSQLRKGALAAACNRLCELGGKTLEDFVKVSEVIYNTLTMLENKEDENCKPPNDGDVIGDPTLVKTKGAPRKNSKKQVKRRRCSNCKRIGHIRRNCPEHVEGNVLDFVEEQSLSETDKEVCDNSVSGSKRRRSKVKHVDESSVMGNVNKDSDWKDMKPLQTSKVNETESNDMKEVNPMHPSTVKAKEVNLGNDLKDMKPKVEVGFENNMFMRPTYVGNNQNHMSMGYVAAPQSCTALINHFEGYPMMPPYRLFTPYVQYPHQVYPPMHDYGLHKQFVTQSKAEYRQEGNK